MAVNYREAIVYMAMSQIGNEAPNGDDKYIEFYNNVAGTSFGVNTTAWCAIFVSYCARHVGVPTSVIPNFAHCTTSRNSFWRPRNRWKTKSYTPKPGDLIYFDWAGSDVGDCDHVGIVVKVDSKYIYSVEGNTKGGETTYGVRYKQYPIGWSQIAGFGIPDYEGTGSTGGDDMSGDEKIVMIKEYQKWINSMIDAGLVIDGSNGPLTKTAAIKTYQTILHSQYGKNIDIDGSFGPATKAAAVAIVKGACGDLVRCGQGQLIVHGFNPTGFDGSFGPGMQTAIKNFQSWAGISVDGSCGPDTWYNLFKKY